ncbi:hypothetical protein HRbin06_00602 [archaeon HR06]|nr:hypothetical protein HRbin06_00602 [archaeon HR06]
MRKYLIIWLTLIISTILQLTFFASSSNLKILGIISLAWFQVSLIVFFYQDLLKEPKGISLLYLVSLLLGSSLIIGMVVSIL